MQSSTRDAVLGLASPEYRAYGCSLARGLSKLALRQVRSRLATRVSRRPRRWSDRLERPRTQRKPGRHVRPG